MSVSQLYLGANRTLSLNNIDSISTSSVKITLDNGIVSSSNGTLISNTLSNGILTSSANGTEISSIPYISINELSTELQNSINNPPVSESLSLDQISTTSYATTEKPYQNYATNWIKPVNAPNSNGVGCACSGNGKYIITFGWGSGVQSYISKDYGNTFSTLSDSIYFISYVAISLTGQYIILNTNNTSNILISDNYGESFSTKNMGGHAVSELAISSTGQHIMVATNSGIYYSSDSGDNFTIGTNTSGKNWSGICMSSDGSTGYAVISNSKIYKTSNSGSSWTEIYSNVDSNNKFHFCKCSADGKYILTTLSQGTQGNVLLSKNYGDSFSNTMTGVYAFKAAISSTGLYMVIVENTGFIYTSVDHGETWNNSGMASTNYYGVAMSVGGDIVYAYAPSNLYMYNANIVSVPLSQPYKGGSGSMYYDNSTRKLYIYNSSTNQWNSITLSV